MSFLIRLGSTMFALWVAVQIVPGLEFDGSVWALAGIALVFGLVNAFIRPILTFLSLPLLIVTLGLFSLVLNAVAFLIVIWISGALDLGLSTSGFWPAFFGAIVVSIVGWAVNAIAVD
jgi:putative membrane protein